MPTQITDIEFSGITDSPAGRFATSEDQQSIINIDDGIIHEVPFEDFLKEKEIPGNLTLSGIAYSNGYFFLLSENYTSIILVDEATFRVQAVFGIETCAASDISVHKGKAYIVIDHNYNEKAESMHVYDMDAALVMLPVEKTDENQQLAGYPKMAVFNAFGRPDFCHPFTNISRSL